MLIICCLKYIVEYDDEYMEQRAICLHEKYKQEVVGITIMYAYGRNKELLRDIS